MKRSKPAADEKYPIGSIDTVKRGFLRRFCHFTKKKGTVDAEALVKEFSGRQIDGHKVDAARVARYIRYCVNNGQFKVAKMSDPLFPLGQVVAIPGALALLEANGMDPLAFLIRHVCGDWGDLDEHDRRENELSLREGFRLLSAYNLPNAERLWIITEADRGVTTLLRPDEY